MISQWYPLGDIKTDQRMTSLIQDLNREFGVKSARQSFTFFQDNVAANQSAVALGYGAIVTERLILRDAFIIGVGVYSNDACTAGTLSVEPTINGSVISYSADLDTTNTQTNTTKIPIEIANFISAGQRLGVKITTDGAWLPVTADITVEVLLVYTGEDVL